MVGRVEWVSKRVGVPGGGAGTFELGGIQLLEFMRDHILAYTDDPDKEIRQAAVLAACRVLERHAAVAGGPNAPAGGASEGAGATGGASAAAAKAGSLSFQGAPR
jgi:hypothetical protein